MMQPSAAAVASAPAPTTAASSCETLKTCCGALVDLTLRNTCEALASSRTEAACAQGATMLCSSPTTITATPQAACTELPACCNGLDEEEQEDCQAVVDDADAAACNDALAELCPDMSTPATSANTPQDACTQLSSCCASLEDDDDQESCQETVDAAVLAACSEAQAELC